MSQALRGKERALVLSLLVIAFISIFITPKTLALPVGASLNYISNSTINATPGDRTDKPGTITIININALQQDYQWKAYVGNVTGKLTLDDSSGHTIYDWTLATVTGEVYTSRYSSIDWATIACASAGTISSEETALGISSSDPDSITNTFSGSSGTIVVGTTSLSGCPATHTYNSSEQPSSDYEEALLQDGNNYLVYYTKISDDANGFDGNTYDFQMIVADNESSTTGNTYYFWVELG